MKLTRRDFVKAITISVSLVPACSGAEPAGEAKAQDGSRFFPQSVASGDPRPGSVVLWTRLEDAQAPDTAQLTLEVATDAGFGALVSRTGELSVNREHDGTLKIKLTGLQPRTTYYYRFLYTRDGQSFSSPIGRTRTAPAASDDVPVRFAVTSCQDFVGRYYNGWQRMVELDHDLDFVLFLGDYVYETTGDPGFQVETAPSQRSVVFADLASAIPLGSPVSTYYAASSLSNYRDLYKTVRSDRFLRAAHERYPFVFMWDDHEYSDDAHGSTSTYSDGLRPEQNDERKRNAERAYFEFVPLDHPDQPDGAIDIDAVPTYPATHIYRDLIFGKNLRLLVADCRTFRSDHLIPEEAYPGTVVVSEDELTSLGAADAFSDALFAYVDIDAAEHAHAKLALQIACMQLAQAAGLDSAAAAAYAQAAVRGNLGLAYVNAVLGNPALNVPAIPADDAARGLAWVHMGKRDLFSSQGSRYVVIKPALDVYSAALQRRSPNTSEDTFGAEQSAWLDSSLASTETWKVLVSSFSLTSMLIDLREASDVPDPALRNLYVLNADQWDGFPWGRRQLLAKLAQAAGNPLVVSGDIHASFASIEAGVPCLTTPAISSGSIRAGAREVVLQAGFAEDSALYQHVVTDIAQTLSSGNSGIAFNDPDSHGFLLVEVSQTSARATFHLLPSSEVQNNYEGRSAELAAKFVSKSFAIAGGAIEPL
jgi:alkaline phosphatase D